MVTFGGHLNAQVPGLTGWKEVPGTYRRTTHKGREVPVHRIEMAWDAKQTELISRQMKDDLKSFPNLTVVAEPFQSKFLRNCFDYAFAPFMSCCPGGQQLEKREAFWMGWGPTAIIELPNWNWKDGSMKLSSTATKSAPTQPFEYIYDQAEVDAVRVIYNDTFGNPIPLPVCNVPTEDVLPDHAAFLLSVHTSDKLPAGKCYGLYQSKWGAGAFYIHRWGAGFCPPIYCNQPSIRLVVPNWTASQYPVNLSPWE